LVNEKMLQYNIMDQLGMVVEAPVLSICLTCRDGREALHKTRGGARLARKVLQENGVKNAITLRGVRCMSQCKRPCIASFSAPECFTYVFGDLDPDRTDHIDALFEFASLYGLASEGFLKRDERPEVLRASILGRLPPIESNSPLVTYLTPEYAE
jgi:predicted metal-binding protein